MESSSVSAVDYKIWLWYLGGSIGTLYRIICTSELRTCGVMQERTYQPTGSCNRILQMDAYTSLYYRTQACTSLHKPTQAYTSPLYKRNVVYICHISLTAVKQPCHGPAKCKTECEGLHLFLYLQTPVQFLKMLRLGCLKRTRGLLLFVYGD